LQTVPFNSYALDDRKGEIEGQSTGEIKGTGDPGTGHLVSKSWLIADASLASC
jgi:hypothetical protein